LGVQDILEIENWTKLNIENLFGLDSIYDLLKKIWPILYEKSKNNNLKKLTPQESCLNLALLWAQGLSFCRIFESLEESDVKFKAGTQIRELTQEMIVDICESAFSYDVTLIISAIIEIINLEEDEDNENYLDLIYDLNNLQKMIKYGLPSILAVSFYELGFADRVIALELENNFEYFSESRLELISDIKENKKEVLEILNKYPSYYTMVLDTIVYG